MPTNTTRYGLIKPTPGQQEVVNVADLNLNSDTIDAALGSKVVNAGVVVPDVDLRDGMIVTEKTTGISYVAVKNNLGGFDKNYINYPYLYVASAASQPVGATGVWADWGWTTWSSLSSFNAPATDRDVTKNFWTVPFKGIYDLHYHDQFGATATTGQIRASAFTFNGTLDNVNTESSHINNGGTTQSNDGFRSRVLNAGDIVGHQILIGVGANPVLYTVFSANLVKRLA